MIRFDVLEPISLEEAVSQLANTSGAVPLAGGTDLLVALKSRVVRPRILVNLKHIPDLNRIEFSPGDGLHIGALVCVESLARSQPVIQHFPIVSSAAGKLGSVQIRNLATVGGNLCHASPSAELAPSLIALGASVRICGETGAREIPLESFFVGPGRTVLQQGEILTEVHVPDPGPGSAGVYLKHAPRKMMDIAVVGVASVMWLTEDLKCAQARIVLGAVAPVPLRVPQVEDLLLGKTFDTTCVQESASLAAAASRPISDIRASATYRREMVRVLAGRALAAAWDGALAAARRPA